MADARRYLVIIKLKDDSTLQRVQQDVPKVIDYLKRVSHGEMEQAFRSNDGLLFGYLIKTDAPHAIVPEFERCHGTANGDNVLAIEAGELAGGLGFSRAWTWLQRH